MLDANILYNLLAEELYNCMHTMVSGNNRLVYLKLYLMSRLLLVIWFVPRNWVNQIGPI